jgi:hypothetical protein
MGVSHLHVAMFPITGRGQPPLDRVVVQLLPLGSSFTQRIHLSVDL